MERESRSVYVISRGEDYEGVDIQHIFSNREDAIKILRKKVEEENNKFRPEKGWKLEEESNDYVEYHRGCDRLCLERYPLE